VQRKRSPNRKASPRPRPAPKCSSTSSSTARRLKAKQALLKPRIPQRKPLPAAPCSGQLPSSWARLPDGLVDGWVR
jgi:hypothetical protein